MSWAAHQFETYAIQAHLPRRWAGRISFLAIVAGDQTPDFVAKFWVYGFDIGGKHYGATEPYKFHRGWPGAGFSHSLGFAALVAGLVYLFTKSRGWSAGVLIGMAAHSITDISDSVGTMLAFPFSTESFSIGAWAYAATPGGKYLDARAYYSSFGFVMDAVWLVILLMSWKVLTERYWREVIVPADPKVWAWMGRRLPSGRCSPPTGPRSSTGSPGSWRGPPGPTSCAPTSSGAGTSAGAVPTGSRRSRSPTPRPGAAPSWPPCWRWRSCSPSPGSSVPVPMPRPIPTSRSSRTEGPPVSCCAFVTGSQSSTGRARTAPLRLPRACAGFAGGGGGGVGGTRDCGMSGGPAARLGA